MESAEQPAGRTRTAFEDLRRSVMGRLRELGFRTTGGVARLLVDGNCGVIEVHKSGRSTAASTLFTVQVGIALGALLPPGAAKPLAHCSAAECDARLRIGDLAEPRADVWWTLASDAPDAAVTAEVMRRIENDAAPFVRRWAAAGALVGAWESGDRLGVSEPERVEFLRRIRAAGGAAGV